MFPNQLRCLGESPAGVVESLDAVAGFDAALADGLARLSERGTAALRALAAALAGSPLGAPAAEAVAKVSAGSITPEYLAVLAAGRMALLGAVHDALLEQVDTALERERASADARPAERLYAGPLAGSRAWLQELAIAGWRGVDHDLVAAADRTIEALLAEPALRRPAVLLDGLAAELRACSPIATLAVVPAARWADLWSRALLLTWRGVGDPVRSVSGRLLPLGVDLQEHGTAVQAQVYALLEPRDGGQALRVRVSVSAPKVDTIVGPAVWQLLTGHPRLFAALTRQQALELTDMPMLPGGELVWRDDRAEAGAAADPFATARVLLDAALGPQVPPFERHPVHVAEPVLMEGYRVDGDSLRLDGTPLALELDRLPTAGPLTAAAVRRSDICLGLLRWDAGGWSLRPLAVRTVTKGKVVDLHSGAWALGPTDPKVVKALAKSGDVVEVLRERAGRLLRK